MPGKRISPDKQAEAVALRTAGYTIDSIAERTGISVRTLARLFRRHETHPGAAGDALLDAARDALIREMNSPEGLASALAASIADDLEAASKLRGLILACAARLRTDDHSCARESARALAQLASGLKATQTMRRVAIGADKADDLEKPTVLEIREMTAEDVEAIRRAQQRRRDLSDDEL